MPANGAETHFKSTFPRRLRRPYAILVEIVRATDHCGHRQRKVPADRAVRSARRRMALLPRARGGNEVLAASTDQQGQREGSPRRVALAVGRPRPTDVESALAGGTQ